MIIIRKENHGAVYTLDPDTNELYYAPIYKDNTVNLSEFTAVDLDSIDDEYDVLTIQKELINLNK